jgi:hypothetical protein
MAIEPDQEIDERAGPGGRPDEMAGAGDRPDEMAGPGGRPDDEAEVVAAIAAAVELCWPRPAPAPPTQERRPATPVWRFSGRWWTKPPQLRRDRPWAEP